MPYFRFPGGCYDSLRTYYDGVDTFAEATDVPITAGADATGIDLAYVSAVGSIVGMQTARWDDGRVAESQGNRLAGNRRVTSC